MPPRVFRTRSPRPLVRAFCPTRLAAEALAHSYERLLPDPRRPLTPPAPTAAVPQPRPPRAASG